MAGETADLLRCFFLELLAFAAKEPAGCGVHNLVVPLSFRCIYIVYQPAMLLKRRAFDQMGAS
jgi:hypothetical protein